MIFFAPVSGFVAFSAGAYRLGKADRVQNPLRKVRLGAFEIARTETTNAQFGAFVAATGYVTDAERRHDGMTFAPPLPEFRWLRDATAFWRLPNGRKGGGIEGKGDHPVTSISYADAEAYCRWAGVRLPTLDEWEAACRAGTTTDYSFGPDRKAIGLYANVWHGRDHRKADLSDGYLTTSPVGSFKPNPRGLYDMYGNVFEFCSGRIVGDRSARQVHARGGSWWCSANACCFFNSVDVGTVDVHASFSNQGFRVARTIRDAAGIRPLGIRAKGTRWGVADKATGPCDMSPFADRDGETYAVLSIYARVVQRIDLRPIAHDPKAGVRVSG